MPNVSLQRGLGWYWKRLSVMGPTEIAYRVGEQWQLQRLRREHGRAVVVETTGSSFLEGAARRLPALRWAGAPGTDETDRLIAGHWPALGWAWRFTDDDSVWRRAPDTGREWGTGFFGSIAYRAGNPTGDVRVAWEPARLQQLLALARVPADDPRAAAAVDLLQRQLLSFVRLNPPWSGIHYVSAMECALRVIAVCHALDRCRGRLTRSREVAAAAAMLVATHADLICRRVSRHSSSGNHTIAEAAGLVHAGVLFPACAAAERWRETGLALLETELPRQILDDGGGLEQAFWYLLFVADLGGLVIELLRHHAQPVPPAIADRVGRARGFLSALASSPEDLPDVGDRDDGHALSSWLRISFAEAPARPPAQSWPAAGYTRLRSSATADVELLFDHGPMGMPPSYGHAHADALSLSVRHAGQPILIEPGTFTYNGNPAWRRYFRSTAAHNTLLVDGLDQAEQQTAFLWSSPVEATLLRSEPGPHVRRLLARHLGYLRLGVVHWRGLVLNDDGCILVWDHLAGRGRHRFDWHWHSGHADVIDEAGWRLAGGWRLQPPEGAHCERSFGCDSPMLGWQAPFYGRLVPIATVRVTATAELPCDYVTLLSPPETDWRPADVEWEVGALRTWQSAA